MRSRRAALALVLGVACAAAYAAAKPPTTPAIPAAPVAGPPPLPAPAPPEAPHVAPLRAQPVHAFTPAAATRRTGCMIHGALPDAACTPGAVMTTDLDVICDESTRERRHVEASVRKAAFTEYGFIVPEARDARGAFEVDHLVPLELGGANGIENLWPQPAEPRPGYHEKDRVEDYLHKEVCSHAMSLDEAQRTIATDWLTVWRRIRATGDDGEE